LCKIERAARGRKRRRTGNAAAEEVAEEETRRRETASNKKRDGGKVAAKKIRRDVFISCALVGGENGGFRREKIIGRRILARRTFIALTNGRKICRFCRIAVKRGILEKKKGTRPLQPANRRAERRRRKQVLTKGKRK